MNGLEKVIKKSVKTAIRKKYKCECRLFWLAIIGIFYIEFLPCIHCPSIWNADTCLKINSITSQLLLAYVASYIFLYINILTKERRIYENYYPQIILILKNLFSVFNEHKERLESLYVEATKEKTFNYDKESIHKIINYLKKREDIYINQYKVDKDNEYTPAREITGSNYLTAGQIYYDIKLLETFNEVLSPDFKTILFEISQNLYIIKLKDKPINNLEFYKIMVNSEIKLYKLIEELREHSNNTFSTDF